MSAKFLVSSVRVIDTVGFLSVLFLSFTRTIIKIPLNSFDANSTNLKLKLQLFILKERREITVAVKQRLR